MGTWGRCGCLGLAGSKRLAASNLRMKREDERESQASTKIWGGKKTPEGYAAVRGGELVTPHMHEGVSLFAIGLFDYSDAWHLKKMSTERRLLRNNGEHCSSTVRKGRGGTEAYWSEGRPPG